MKKITILKRYSLLFLLLFLPSVTSAAAITNLKDLINLFGDLIKMLGPLIMALSVLAFLWGLLGYIFHGGNEAKREEGRKFIVWGLVVLFVMVTFWGLVEVLANTFFPGSMNNVPQKNKSIGI